MNLFLVIVILSLAAGGYYEHTILQQKRDALVADDQNKVRGLNAQIDALKQDEKKLSGDLAGANKNISDAQQQQTDLTAQLQVLQKPVAEPPKPVEAKPAPVLSNALATIVTSEGKTFHDCKLLKVQADGIVVNSDEGITELPFVLLPSDLQKRFGFDLQKEAQLTPEEAQAQENLRVKADSLPGAQPPGP